MPLAVHAPAAAAVAVAASISSDSGVVAASEASALVRATPAASFADALGVVWSAVGEVPAAAGPGLVDPVVLDSVAFVVVELPVAVELPDAPVGLAGPVASVVVVAAGRAVGLAVEPVAGPVVELAVLAKAALGPVELDPWPPETARLEAGVGAAVAAARERSGGVFAASVEEEVVAVQPALATRDGPASTAAVSLEVPAARGAPVDLGDSPEKPTVALRSAASSDFAWHFASVDSAGFAEHAPPFVPPAVRLVVCAAAVALPAPRAGSFLAYWSPGSPVSLVGTGRPARDSYLEACPSS